MGVGYTSNVSDPHYSQNMSTNRSHLIPTPTVDKNGVTSTRHKKPDTAPTLKPSSIPPVILPSVAASSSQDEADQLHFLLYGQYGGDRNREFLDELQQHYPTALTFAIHLLNTGEESSRTRVRHVLDQSFRQMAVFQSRGDRWREEFFTEESSIKHRMLAGWHVGPIVEETGTRTNPIDLDDRAVSYDSLINYRNVRGDRTGLGSEYWRGLAILAASNKRLIGRARDDAPAFVMWAGQQPDAALIVRLVTERDTLNVDALSDLVDQNKQTTPSLRDGIL